MEEDTELRDLVVQTLESNGVLAKIRVRLREAMFREREKKKKRESSANLCRLGECFRGENGRKLR